MHFVEAKGILSAKNGMNIYRGCSHGCIYCDSRSLCYNFTHPFEDIEVKQNAPELLRKRLRGKRQKCMIGTGAMSDPYMHCEETLRLTRRCLEVIEEEGFGVTVQTKSDRVLRDLELLERINNRTKAVVQMTLTTLDDALCKVIEPNVCPTSRRAEVLAECRTRGIPTVVWMTPMLPFINDTRENVEGLLNICVREGVKGIICPNIGVTLREGDREYFYAALDRSFPGLKQKYIRTYGNAYEVLSPDNDALMPMVREVCTQNGILQGWDEVFGYLHTFEEKEKIEQLSFFD